METRRDFLSLAGLAAAAAALPGCAGSLATSDPWSARQIEVLENSAGQNGGRGWAAWQCRRQVAAWNPGERGPSLSITKSIAALAATRAAQDGWLDAGEPVCATVPEWRADPLKKLITVRMLLQQTSGLEAGVITLYRNHPADKGAAAISLRCTDFPGTVFRYGPGHWEVLAEVLRRKLSRDGRTLPAFMGKSVMNPIGLYSGNWRSDRHDNPYFSTGTELSVKELGKLGRTIGQLLAGHDADGFSAPHFAEMTRTSTANPMFGGGLWRNTRAGSPGASSIEVERSIDSPLSSSFWSRACLSIRQPAELVALIGSGGRRIYIWPHRGKTVARIGSGASWSDTGFLARLASP